jgi:dienelactone hydrolase
MPLAQAGAVVLTIDAPFARRNPDSPLAFTPQDSADVVQFVVDLQRAVDVLAARPDVDPARIGALGISYGGATGALFAGVERRLAGAVLMVGDGGPGAHFTDSTGARMAPPPGVPMEQWCRWFEAMEPIASTRFVARAAPTPLLFQWGRHDQLVPPYLADALWRAAAEPKEARWYESGHRIPTTALEDARSWLAAHVGLTPPPAFRGPAAAYAGTYAGQGGRGGDRLEVQVIADSAGRLALRGPMTSPEDATGRITYLGASADGQTFQLDEKLLTFVQTAGRVTALQIDVPIDAPQVHLVLQRQPAAATRSGF